MRALHWIGNYGGLQLRLLPLDVETGSHPGRCDEDIAYLASIPRIRRQLDAMPDEAVVSELSECGAWEPEEMQDREENLQRILWIACGNISEEMAAKARS